jgi:hypothetical protein
VRTGQEATGSVLGSSERLVGTVRALPSAIDSSTGLGTVRIALEKSSEVGTVGAYGQMHIVTQQHRGALLVPANALRGAMVDGPDIVICKDGTALVRSMKVGVYNEQKVEVLAGVDESEFVAIDHVLGLSNETAIRQLP